MKYVNKQLKNCMRMGNYVQYTIHNSVVNDTAYDDDTTFRAKS